jgi:PAS domain-containing protein
MKLLAAPPENVAPPALQGSTPFVDETQPCCADLSPILIFEWELPRDEADVSESNEDADAPLRWFGTVEAHLGYDVGEWPHTFEAWCEALHPADRQRVLDSIERHLQSGEPFFESCRARRRDGSWLRWIHSGVATRSSDGEPWKFTWHIVGYRRRIVRRPNGERTACRRKFPIAGTAGKGARAIVVAHSVSP